MLENIRKCLDRECLKFAEFPKLSESVRKCLKLSETQGLSESVRECPKVSESV